MTTQITSYRLDSVIEENGIIVLPDVLKSLYKHRVRLVVIDLETIQRNPVTHFQNLTRRYKNIVDEPDLDVTEIYKEREQSHDRGAVFA